MSDEVKSRMADLEAANTRLNESLKRCRQLVADCQSKLAANGHEKPDNAPLFKKKGG